MATQVALADAHAQEGGVQLSLAFKERAWVPTFFFLVGVVTVQLAPDLAEAAFDGVCGAHGLAPGWVLEEEAGEQLVEVSPQAGDRLGVELLPAPGEDPGGLARGDPVLGVHDLVQGPLDGVVVGGFDLVEDVTDLVRPAALDWDPLTGVPRTGKSALATLWSI